MDESIYCAYCKQRYDTARRPTKEHIRPATTRKKKGSFWIVVCEQCNNNRGDKQDWKPFNKWKSAHMDIWTLSEPSREHTDEFKTAQRRYEKILTRAKERLPDGHDLQSKIPPLRI